jgi:hypothetical protein
MAHNEHHEELAALQALGLPLGEEWSTLARHLEEGCPTCEQLLVELREASTALAVEAPERRPNADLRRRILSSLGPGRVAPSARRNPSLPWLLAAAAVLLFVMALWDDARLRRQREELRSQSVELSSRLATAEKDLARKDLRARVVESDDVRLLYLGGKDPQPGARAKLFWSEKAKRGVIVAGNLAPLPPDKQYELWVFSEGKPVPAGVFDADPAGRAVFESPDLSSVASAQNFAVTVEPRGGVPQPTGPIVLIGTT